MAPVVSRGRWAGAILVMLGSRPLGPVPHVLAAHGLLVDLVPDKFVGEGLSAAFPAGRGRVVLAQAEAARPVVADGLRGKGWTVDFVVAYRTNPAVLDPELVQRAAQADAITFTSSSTVANYLHGAGPENVPAVVVCIGPVTAATARERGLHVNAVAEPHSLDGLVAATVAALQRTD